MKSKHKAVPNFDAVQLALKVAALTERPEAIAEIELLRELWQELHALRVTGASFRQIAALLRQGGFSISRQDLDILYTEILCEKWEEGIEGMKGVIKSLLRSRELHMRAIFVDFDGVLHDANILRVDSQVGGKPIRRAIQGRQLFEYAHLLAELLEPYPDVQVIVHSSWRRDSDADECRSMLAHTGLRIDGITPLLLTYRGLGSARQASIEQYVREYGITDWIVLDDEPQHFDESWLEGCLVVCDESLGLSLNVTLEAVRQWLSRAESGISSE